MRKELIERGKVASAMVIAKEKERNGGRRRRQCDYEREREEKISGEIKGDARRNKRKGELKFRNEEEERGRQSELEGQEEILREREAEVQKKGKKKGTRGGYRCREKLQNSM